MSATAASFPPLSIGLIGSAYFGGMLVGCIAAPRIIARAGHIRAFSAFVAIATVATLLHPIFVDPAAWAGIRAFTGFCFAGLYATIESWMHDKADNVVRGRVLAIYQIVHYAGSAIGQQAIRLISPASFVPFSMVAAALALSVLPLAYTRSDPPEPPPAPRLRFAWLFRISPVGVVGALVSGSANGTFWSLSPVFAERSGLSQGAVASFMTATILGAALVQWPIGRLADRSDRRLIMLGAIAVAVAAQGMLVYHAKSEAHRADRARGGARRIVACALSALLQPRAGSRGPRERRGGLVGTAARLHDRRDRRPDHRGLDDGLDRPAGAVHPQRRHPCAVRAVHRVAAVAAPAAPGGQALSDVLAQEVLAQDTTIAARDGYALAATVFAPHDPPRGAVLINSATAVPRKIYRGFATYLAQQGFTVLTYDYRGTAGSRPPSLRGFKVRMRDWAALDVAAAIDHMRHVWPRLPLAVVGHSFGGQAVGLAPNNGEITRALLVAAQAGYWRLFHSPGEVSRLSDAAPDRQRRSRASSATCRAGSASARTCRATCSWSGPAG